MSMDKETGGIWSVWPNKTGAGISSTETDGAPIEATPKNSRRIVACVNACAGISTELLEECPTLSFSSYTQVRETQQERDHFRVALVRAMAKVESAICCHPNAVRTLLEEAMEIAGSAIANGKGGAA